jgi:hypothetical protein
MKFHTLINKKIINEGFSVETLEFNLCRFIEESRTPVTMQSIKDHFYGKNDKLNLKFLELLVKRKFVCEDSYIKPSSDQYQFFQLSKMVINESKVNVFSKKMIEDLSIDISRNLINRDVTLRKVVFLKKEFEKNTTNSKHFESRIYNLLIFYDDYYIKVDKLINAIDEKYEKESVNSILYFDYNSTLLEELKIKTLGDLKSINVEAILCILFDEIDVLITNLQVYSNNLKEEIIIVLDHLKEKLELKQWKVLLLRFGKEDNDNFTLDEIGRSMHLTRERIRQIERKAIDKLKILYYQNELLFNTLLFSLSKENDYLYASSSQLIQILNNRDRQILFRILLTSYPKYYHYNKPYSCYFSIKNGNENILKKHIINKLGSFIKLQEFLEINDIVKKIIQEFYKPMASGWLRKGFSVKDLIIELISLEFKDGYHISSDFDYEKLKRIFSDKYGLDLLIVFPSKRSLVGFIDRSNYVQIDRGTYIDASFSPTLEDPLKAKVLSFLKNSNEVVYYRTLFLEFQKELEDKGILNHYHLKGLLDPFILGKFDYQRDYIKTRVFQSSPLDTIRNLFRKEKKSFRISQIKNKFPGVKIYVFSNVLYEEEDTNGLIRLNRDEYIYALKLKLEKPTITKLKEFIDKHLTADDMVVSSKKLFGKLYYEEPNLLKLLPYINNQFGLFSLIRHLFIDEYFFRRPKIAKSKEALEDQLKIYILSLKDFDKKVVEDFLNNRGLRSIYSYLDFIEEMSEDFVQISRDKMIRKDCLDVSDYLLNIIENIVNGLLKFKPNLEVNDIKNFSTFPKLPVMWNQFVLVGIIRSYLEDKFEIKNDSAMYDSVNFTIIKR